MSNVKRFYLEWMILNPLGFTLGGLLGATDNGFIPAMIPGQTGLILGDLVFGAMVGFTQYIVFRRTVFMSVSIQWIFANSIGFTLGARTGALLTFKITNDWMLAGTIFGIFMGGSIGLATALTLYKHIAPERLFIWIITSMTGWAMGETIAFASLFSLKTLPLVALAIAGITGIGLIYIWSQPQIKTRDQAV